MLYNVGFFNPRGGVGSTLIAAHLFYYLKEAGANCSAITHRPNDRGRSDLEDRWGVSPNLGTSLRIQDLELAPRAPGPDVHIQDFRRDFPLWAVGRVPCDLSIVVMSDPESFERGMEALPHLSGAKLCVWNQASPALRARCRLPDSIHVARASLPHCSALARASANATPVWRLPGGSTTPGGRAMLRVLREIVRSTALDVGTILPVSIPLPLAVEGVAR